MRLLLLILTPKLVAKLQKILLASLARIIYILSCITVSVQVGIEKQEDHHNEQARDERICPRWDWRPPVEWVERECDADQADDDRVKRARQEVLTRPPRAVACAGADGGGDPTAILSGSRLDGHGGIRKSAQVPVQPALEPVERGDKRGPNLTAHTRWLGLAELIGAIQVDEAHLRRSPGGRVALASVEQQVLDHVHDYRLWKSVEAACDAAEQECLAHPVRAVSRDSSLAQPEYQPEGVRHRPAVPKAHAGRRLSVLALECVRDTLEPVVHREHRVLVPLVHTDETD
mmetsp:Transcript_3532/g.9135  ORF Transcript_3532/g.9135 Transcript_3532/m.9135 type:complete len:288 (-) Transcript_3532:755-1618(-)